jgi:GNAT superfamily N-acetyltransferase
MADRGGPPRVGAMTGVARRAATAGDQPFLRAMVFEALFVPPGADPFPPETVDVPIAHYHEHFGDRPGDLGVIAEDAAGRPIGAAWVRRFPSTDPGYGFVDENTPELTIATMTSHRGQGVGTLLLQDLMAMLERCSLSVDRRNRAMALYERLGFRPWAADGDSVTLLWTR